MGDDCPKRERNSLTTLINNLTDAVFHLDANGIIRLYNAAALNLLDTNRDVTGEQIDEVLKLQNTKKEPVSILPELAKSAKIKRRDDLVMTFDDLDEVRLEGTLAPVQSGDMLEIQGYVLILRDITKAKSLEQERDEFISVVSHELRTPIAIAEGALSNVQLLIKRGAYGRMPEAITEAHNQIIFLAGLINDLSTLSRAKQGVADEPELIDVKQLALEFASAYMPQAEARGLTFNLDLRGQLGSVHTSRLYLQELLQNILINAVKYTITGSVTLKIHAYAGTLTFAVIDTGIGIGRTDQKKIFDRFYRAEDYRTRETSGTGLGLYVADKLAKKLGCRIYVKSRLNYGSTFSFSLPQAKEVTE